MKTRLLLACLALGLLTMGVALAQRPATTKAMGTAYDMWSSGVYFNHAADHARVMRSYATAGDQVPRDVVQRHYDAVRSNLAAAKKAQASLADAHKDDKTASQHLATIDEHHAKALAAINKLNPADGEGPLDSKVVKKSSTATLRALRKAKAEHTALMKHLKVKGLNAGAKGKGKGKAKAKTNTTN